MAPAMTFSRWLNGEIGVSPGDIVRATVVEADEYDLWAELKEARQKPSATAE